MHELVFREFNRICKEREAGGRVLEVGATPDRSSLLNMESLKSAKTKVGVNLEGPSRFADYEILRANANSMTCFEDEEFDTVLCNSTLEHDRYFWKTISEMRRTAKSGGLIVIGTPGYVALPRMRKLKRLFKRFFAGRRLEWMGVSTLTYGVHDGPGDYFRFSEQAFGEVFFEGMKEVEINTLMVPPRIVGAGYKP